MKKQKLFDVVEKLMVEGMVLTGGFIRDFLIRGEPFLDMDFYAFDRKQSKIVSDWGYACRPEVVNLMANKVWKTNIDGIVLNVIQKPLSYFNDVSCNRFGFDGKNLYLKKSTLAYCPIKSWEMIFQKRFKVHDGTINPDSRNVIVKLRARGWSWDGRLGGKPEDFKELEDHNPNGPWTDFEPAKRRFDEFFA